MEDESKKREKLKFNDIQKLSQFIENKHNPILTGEIGFAGYRMDKILKEYANFPLDENIHAFFEHGIIFTDFMSTSFRNHEYLPSIVASKYRKNVLKKEKYYSKVYTIGPYIHYANSLLKEDELKAEKERLGKTLLVFPNHSVDGLIIDFDYNTFIQKINEISKDFDSVRICMYYKDVLLGRAKPYKNEGFEVVTAGHGNDYNFIKRLKSIILTSDMTMSNGIGSHLGYCIYLNKPHFLYQLDEITHKAENHSNENAELLVKDHDRKDEIMNKNQNVINIKREFTEYGEKITKSQYDLMNYLWGFDEVKTPIELNEIFNEINNNHSQFKYYLSGLIRLKDLIKYGR